MTSITTQQTKLNLELVPKENRLDIRKCNGRIPRGLKLKEENFQVVLDALALTPCYDVPEVYMHQINGQDFDALPSEEDTVSFLRELGHTGVINSLNDVVIDQMHQPWRTFAALINRSLSGKTTTFDKLRLSRAHILWGIKEAYQKYGAVLPKCLTSPQMKESKAYKTYLCYATGTVPPKVDRKFKKASPSKKDSVPLPADEEPVQKGKRVKRSAKKSSTTPTTGIDLLSEVAPTEEAQMKEVRKKRLRDFYKSRPSGSGLVAKKPPSFEKITPPVTSEGTGSERENDSEEHESDSEQDTDGSELDSESDPQKDDDEVIDDDDEVKDDDEDADNDDDKSEEITQEQVVEDAHVTITKKTKVPVTSSSRSSDLASKFLKFSDIPPANAEIVSPLNVHVYHEVPRIHTSTLLVVSVSVIPEASSIYTNIPQSSQTFTFPPLQSTPTPLPTTKTTNIPPSILDFTSVFRFNDIVIALEKYVTELKNDLLHTQASSQPRSTYEAAATLTKFELKNILIDKMNSSESYLTAPEHRECYNGLIKSYNLEKDFFSSYDVYSLKRSRDDNDKDEGPSVGSNRGLKKRKTSKDAEPTTSPKTKDSSSRSSKGIMSQPKSFRKSIHAGEPEFKVGYTDTPQGQEGNQGNDNDEPRTESASRCDWFTKPSRLQEPIALDWNEYKTFQKGPTQNWLMTLATLLILVNI
uniref:Uncharacterized protein n=1 Tax=Tanacetum cinerariifolium TaxID=118510 RepID=A0A6L2KL35_TANCI|nr:hypothetical protein [Tanacetum cinerariifolium]